MSPARVMSRNDSEDETNWGFDGHRTEACQGLSMDGRYSTALACLTTWEVLVYPLLFTKPTMERIVNCGIFKTAHMIS